MCHPPRRALETELVSLRLRPGGPTVLAKEEFAQPGGSIKDRPARAMFAAAIRSGELRRGQRVLDAGSGSTAVAEAQAAAELGHPFTAVLPEGTSRERIQLIELYSGEVRLTPKADGLPGAIREAERLAAEGYGFNLRQFENPANPEAHRRGTAREIARQLPRGRVDAFACGCGTGGTLYGTCRGLLDLGHRVLPVAARPVLHGQFSTSVPGIADGLGFATPQSLPGLRLLEVDESMIFATLRRLHRMGLGVGPSSGLNVAAALAIAEELGPHATVVTVLVDRADRYLSTGLLAKCA